MKTNALILGAGYFSQRVHIDTLKKNKKINKIFLFDERKKLQHKVAKKFDLDCFNPFPIANKGFSDLSNLEYIFFVSAACLDFNLSI